MAELTFRDYPSALMIFQGDIHINARLDADFEKKRLAALSDQYLQIASKSSNKAILCLVGDVFDYDTPSYAEIKLFYDFVDSLKDTFDILVTSGNHDPSIFTFLPELNYNYIHTQYKFRVGHQIYNMVSWQYLKTYMQTMQPSSDILLTHARATYGKFVIEEVDFEALSKNHKEVILGDIHDYYQPYPNVTYTSSPSSVTFVQDRAKHGCLVTHKNKTSFKPCRIPTKKVKSFTDVQKAVDFIKSMGEVDDLYKVKIACNPEEVFKLRFVSHPKVRKDIKIVTPEVQKNERYQQSLHKIRQFLSEQADVTQFIFDHIGEKRKVSKSKVTDYFNLLKQIAGTK